LSAFLYHGLAERGVSATCVCARHAKGLLSARVNKSDPHDAEGLAQMARTGWFKAVRIKAEATHMDRAQLKIREQLIASRLAMAGQLRGLLKLFGLRLGNVTTPNKRRERLKALFTQKPELESILAPLIESLEALEVQIRRSSRQLAAQAAADPVALRLMTTPGVGPITALVFKASIEDPTRFARGDDAGAFAGLAPRRNQSGARDRKGRISKAGDPMLRSALYEAANNLLSRVKRPCALQTWGKRLTQPAISAVFFIIADISSRSAPGATAVRFSRHSMASSARRLRSSWVSRQTRRSASARERSPSRSCATSWDRPRKPEPAFADDRVFLLEDTPELQCSAWDLVAVLTRRSPKPIGVVDLVRDALRMRPDRIVVGEMRDGAAALETLKAWNTGHPGGLSTIHANSAQEALARLEDLLLEVVAQPPRRAIAQAIDLIVHIRRTREGRRIDGLLALEGPGDDGGYRLVQRL
jgi:transposase